MAYIRKWEFVSIDDKLASAIRRLACLALTTTAERRKEIEEILERDLGDCRNRVKALSHKADD